MLLDGIYVFFEVCAILAIVIAALWLATEALGLLYELVTGELPRRDENAPEREAHRRPHVPTTG